MDDFDAAVEWALVQGIDPDEYLKDLLGHPAWKCRKGTHERDDDAASGGTVEDRRDGVVGE